MKKFWILALVCAVTVAFISCDKGEEPETTENGYLTFIWPSRKNQSVPADQSNIMSVYFVAKADWTATVTDGADWAYLIGNDVASTVSGEAGEHDLDTYLLYNVTGKDRTATITLTCGGDRATITVTQLSVTYDGKDLTPKGILTSVPWELVSVSGFDDDGEYVYIENDDDGYYFNHQNNDATVTFKEDGSIVVTGADADVFTDYFGLGATYTTTDKALTLNISSPDAILPGPKVEFRYDRIFYWDLDLWGDFVTKEGETLHVRMLLNNTVYWDR